MALPLSRNRTYSASSPVHSADLNAIQDAIIGAKHGEIPIVLPPQAFFPRATNAPVYTVTGGDIYWDFVGGGDGFVDGRLVLPEGSRILRFDLSYDRNGAGTMRGRIYKITPGAFTSIADTGNLTTGVGIATASVTGVNYTLEAAHGLYVNVLGTDTANRFHSACVWVTKP